MSVFVASVSLHRNVFGQLMTLVQQCSLIFHVLFSKQQKQDCCSKKALYVTFKILYFYAFLELVAARLVEHGTTDRMDPGL